MLGGGSGEGEGGGGLFGDGLGYFCYFFLWRTVILLCCGKASFWSVREGRGISAWWGQVVDGDGTGFGHGKGSQWTLFAWIYT